MCFWIRFFLRKSNKVLRNASNSGVMKDSLSRSLHRNLGRFPKVLYLKYQNKCTCILQNTNNTNSNQKLGTFDTVLHRYLTHFGNWYLSRVYDEENFLVLLGEMNSYLSQSFCNHYEILHQREICYCMINMTNNSPDSVYLTFSSMKITWQCSAVIWPNKIIHKYSTVRVNSSALC